MRCKCGNEIQNVPEHLRDLVDWQCQQCADSVPKQRMVGKTEIRDSWEQELEHEEEAA
ncbi:MAG: hypothetical protein NT018_12415 [Armatimonadetes bacterium]|nr:hypothetical protein [Armatimonadota bacterium]